jgi:hypothetical protein
MITINGKQVEARPLTILTDGQRNALYLQMIEMMKASADADAVYFADKRQDTVFVYATCVIVCPALFLDRKAKIDDHIQAFFQWCDGFKTFDEIKALFAQIEAGDNPGDSRTVPPEKLSADEKKL